jgi:competence protein ComGC
MTGLIVCCLVVLAVVMIPKVIRHRKQVKQNESEKTVQDKESEVEMIVVPSERHTLEQSMADYKRRFITNTKEPRSKKSIGIRTKYHKRISQIVEFIGDDEVSVFSYMDNVLKQHFETFHEEISEHYKNYDDDYLIPRR